MSTRAKAPRAGQEPARPEPVTPTLLRAWPLPGGGSGKDDRGSVLVIGGARMTPGAALLAGVAALRSGAGRLTLAVAESVAVHLAVALPEAGVLGLPETASGHGQGLRGSRRPRGTGSKPRTRSWWGRAWTTRTRPPRCSAGSSRCPRGNSRRPSSSMPSPWAACPSWPGAGPLGGPADPDPECHGGGHPAGARRRGPAPGRARARGEVRRGGQLPGCDRATGRTAAGGPARRRRARASLWEITTGHSGLGTSGSGDVLSGAIAGLRARGTTDAQAACWGTHLHAAPGTGSRAGWAAWATSPGNSRRNCRR